MVNYINAKGESVSQSVGEFIGSISDMDGQLKDVSDILFAATDTTSNFSKSLERAGIGLDELARKLLNGDLSDLDMDTIDSLNRINYDENGNIAGPTKEQDLDAREKGVVSQDVATQALAERVILGTLDSNGNRLFSNMIEVENALYDSSNKNHQDAVNALNTFNNLQGLTQGFANGAFGKMSYTAFAASAAGGNLQLDTTYLTDRGVSERSAAAFNSSLDNYTGQERTEILAAITVDEVASEKNIDAAIRMMEEGYSAEEIALNLDPQADERIFKEIDNENGGD